MRKYFLLIGVFALFSFAGISLKKRISDERFRYEFYTTDASVFPEPEREYFWFKGGAIHNTEFGIGGEVLHKEYLKFYHSNQLAEAGKYNKGLKTGLWKTWFPNGGMHSKAYWSDGQKDGSFFSYDETGFLVEQGKYKNNKKHGRWINFISKDTLKYKDGKVVIKKIKAQKDTLNAKPGFFKRIFSKKAKKDSTIDPAVTAQDNMQQNGTEKKKEGFFKRMFSKKEKKATEQEVKTEQPAEKKKGFFSRIFSKKEKKETNGTGS
ncbi:hypothetical protein D3C87_420010 [compost metagenome]